MALDVQIVTGPQASKVSKSDAERQLRSAPQFPKNASVDIQEVDGRWVAAIATVKEAEFPPSDEDSSEAPESPVEDSLEDTPSDDGPPSDSDDDGDEAPSEEKSEEKHEKGEAGELKQLLHMLTTLFDALGIDPNGGEGDSPIPGLDGHGHDAPGPEGIPGSPAPGGEAPPHVAPGGGVKNHTVHERALKPGEAPPGATPIGSPAFASVSDDHPWKDVVGVKRSFPVEAAIGDQKLSQVKAELDALAEGTGYQVKQLKETTAPDGSRIAAALISR